MAVWSGQKYAPTIRRPDRPRLSDTRCRQPSSRGDPLCQHANQSEQSSRRVEVDLDLARQPFSHQFRALVVQAAPAHVDRLDPRLAAFLNRLDVAVHQHLVILHEAPERAQSQADGGQRGDRLFAVGLDERRERASGIIVQNDTLERHIVVGSDFSMFRLSISPTVPPLIGWIRPSARTSVNGTKIAVITQIGSCSLSTMNNNGITTWPTMRMVKYGGASSARARPSGAAHAGQTGDT